jgi:hypothetical protein
VINPEKLRWSHVATDRPSEVKLERPYRRKQQHFLKGPISLEWLANAARQRGRAFQVAVWLCYLVGILKRDEVVVSVNRAAMFGLDRWAFHRGLRALEEGGLVTVQRAAGRNPVVTLIGAKVER